MRFLYPQYFKLLYLLVALFPLWLYHLSTKHKTRLGLGAGRPLRNISHLSSLGRESVRYLMLNLILAALIFALTHPQLTREKAVSEPKKMDIVFLLDSSPSMRADDIKPSRLQRALEVIGTFSRKKLPHDRIALVSFSAGSLILSYLTEDPNNIHYYLDYLRDEIMPSFGTNIGRALKNGLTVLTKELEVTPEAALHKRVFILVSDGEDHGKELESAIQEVKRIGIKVHTIGIGSKEGAPIPISWQERKIRYVEDNQGNKIITRFDERTLRWIAEETGGNAYRSFTGQELENIFREIVLNEREIEGFKKVIEYEDIYQGFLLAAFSIFLSAMLI